MWPRVTRISEDRRTASEKSWVIEVSAARKRLPKLWPPRPEPLSKRWRKSRESRASSSLRATIQLRISPGGSMLSSLRRRPLEPPSSLTVTTAQRSRMTGESGWATAISAGERAKTLSPLSSVERPVPPPMATTRRPRSRVVFSIGNTSVVLVSIPRAVVSCKENRSLRRFVFPEVAFRRSHVRSRIRIQQLRKARIFGQVVEIGIVARLETQAAIQAKRLIQMLERIFDVPGKTIECGQAIDDEISLRRFLEQLFDVFERRHG